MDEQIKTSIRTPNQLCRVEVRRLTQIQMRDTWWAPHEKVPVTVTTVLSLVFVLTRATA